MKTVQNVLRGARKAYQEVFTFQPPSIPWEDSQLQERVQRVGDLVRGRTHPTQDEMFDLARASLIMEWADRGKRMVASGLPVCTRDSTSGELSLNYLHITPNEWRSIFETVHNLGFEPHTIPVYYLTKVYQAIKRPE